MATLKENLEQLISTKKNIKSILETYSVDTITDQFSTYADNIRNLYSSKTCLNSLFEGSTDASFSISISFPWTKVVGTAQMFKDCTNLNTLDTSTWDMSNVITVFGMFNNAGITELDLSSLDWKKVRDAGRVFQSMPNCTTIKLPNNLAPILANHMFYNNSKLTTIEGLDNIDMSKCESIKSIFYLSNYQDMTKITNWNISNMKDISYAFAQSAATTIDLSNWDTSNVTNMQATFYNNTITDYSSVYNWNTSKVEDCCYLFGKHTKITSLDLSNWDFSSCMYMAKAFLNATNLVSLKLPQNINKVLNLQGTFQKCPIELLDVSNIDTSNCLYLDYTFTAGASTTFPIATLTGYENWNTSNVTTFKATFQNQSKLTSLDLSNWSLESAKDLSWMFCGCSGLTELKLGNLANQATTLLAMFQECSSLTELNVDNLCTSACTSVGQIFYGDSSLISLDLSTWDFSNCTSMASMFGEVSNLASLKLPKSCVNKASSLRCVFYNCFNLSTVDVTNLCTSTCQNLYFAMAGNDYMSFREIKGLDTWDTSNVTDMSVLFQTCAHMEDFSGIQNWNTGKVTQTDYMFNNCFNLQTIDLSKWDMRMNTTIRYMFNRNYSLKSIDVSNWDLQSCTKADRFVQLTESLKSLDLSTWKNTGNITTYANFLYNFGSSVIEYLDISGLDTTSVTSGGLDAFVSNCTYLKTIIFGEAFGKCKIAITLDLSTIGSHQDTEASDNSEVTYELDSRTYDSMLTMYDRATAGLPAMTIKFSTHHNIPEEFIDKMTAKGYTITTL